MPKVCLALPKTVSPLRGKPVLFPDLGTPVPTASRALPHPILSLDWGGERGEGRRL